MLANKRPIEYRNSIIKLETKSTKLRIAGIECHIDIGIIELEDLDMLISYNWLDAYNPAIDWRIKTILRREPVHKVAGVRRETRLTN